MFRKRDPQDSLFRTSNLVPPDKAEWLQASWAEAFRSRALPLIDEAVFAPLYCQDNGKRMVRAFLPKPGKAAYGGVCPQRSLWPRIDPDTGLQATRMDCELGRRTGKRSSGSCLTLAVRSAPCPRVQIGASFYLYSRSQVAATPNGSE